MTNKHLTALLAAGLVALAPLARAQQSGDDEAARRAEEKARQKAEQQMREAEQEMKEAQRKLRDAERQMRDAAREIARHAQEKIQKEFQRKMVVFGDHARIGVILRSEADPKTDVVGAEIQGLTPGGPAEEAGVKVGDIVVKLNGKILTTPFIDVDVDEDESAPAARLRESVAEMHDGDKVELVVKRGSELKSISLTARRMGGPLVGVWTGKGKGFDFDLDIDVDTDIGDESIRSHTIVVRDWLDLELTSLNPELGEYFGASEGVLVTRTPKDESLKLKAGDVILKVGDRAAATPSKVLRALRSYDAGETVSIDVLRRKERLTLQATVPQNARHSFVWAPAPPAPPAPAAPAAKPVPPEAPAPPAPPAKPSKGQPA